MLKITLKITQLLLSPAILAALSLCYTGCASAQENETMKPTPAYIKLEIEDFDGLDLTGFSGSRAAKGAPPSPWKARMAWYPQWSRGGSSGWWAASVEANVAAGAMTQNTFIPQNGDYTIWV